MILGLLDARARATPKNVRAAFNEINFRLLCLSRDALVTKIKHGLDNNKLRNWGEKKER